MTHDDSEFVVGVSDMSVAELFSCDPARDRHVWPATLEVDEATLGDAVVDTLPGFPTEDASDGVPHTFRLCRCGARRFGEKNA